MVDIHCHVLPGIDDGSPDLETSVAMCQAAAADGVTHVVGTPHCSDEYEFSWDVNTAKRDELQKAVGATPQLLLGCDFHLNDINLELLKVAPDPFLIAQQNHLLVENSNYSLPPQMEQMFFSLRCRGIIPVLTHPERNPLWQRKPDLLKRLAQQDCVIQITAGSIVGRMGRGPKKYAMEWLHEGIVHVVASDAHNTTGRPLKLKEAFDVVAQEIDPDTADLLFTHNPKAIIEGSQTYQPQPPKKRKWGFLGF
jgi:protein-tyrosine phosphatase